PGEHSGPHGSDPFTRRVVVMIGMTAVLSAIAGYTYSVSAARMSEASFEGFRDQVEMIKRSTGTSADLIVALDRLAAAMEERVRCAFVAQLPYLPRTAEEVAETAAPPAAGERTCMYATALDPQYAILDGPQGVDADPRFPAR